MKFQSYIILLCDSQKTTPSIPNKKRIISFSKSAQQTLIPGINEKIFLGRKTYWKLSWSEKKNKKKSTAFSSGKSITNECYALKKLKEIILHSVSLI